MNKSASGVHEALATINRTWRELRPRDMQPCLHPEITMVLPGFSGVIAGRGALIEGFVDFCTNARVIEYTERDEQIQVVGTLAFVSYHFEMVYERGTYRARSSGRDLWAFEKTDGKWIAIWRTMVDLQEHHETTAQGSST
jgi:hypothetical protein